MALRAYKIPPLVLLITALALAAGELACGTGLYFVTMMAIAMLSIGITYNMLGGLSRISGFMFAAMAAASIVISQFAKVILFEPADKNIEAPHTTITVYAVYYFCVMAGVFAFGWVRLRLPKPHEPHTTSQSRVLYFMALLGGGIASTIFSIEQFGSYQDQTSTSHSISLAFSYLLLFSVVLAVDRRIRESKGKYSLSIWVIVSGSAAIFYQYLVTSRLGMITPIAIYFLACYVRGYRLKARHYLALSAAVILFLVVLSPFEIYSRPLMLNLNFRDRLTKGYSLLVSPPGWQAIWDYQADTETHSTYDEYYSQPGTYVLSRLSLIRADSDLIDACKNGYHYGFKPLLLDLETNIPRFLYKGKPNESSALFIEGIVGQGDQSDKPDYWNYTAVSDSFGAFGWLGTILFPLLVVPLVFVVYESMFDMTRPWGTVALGVGALGIWGGSMSSISVLLIKDPIYLWLMSLLVGGITRFVAVSGLHGSWKREGRLLGDPETQSVS